MQEKQENNKNVRIENSNTKQAVSMQ